MDSVQNLVHFLKVHLPESSENKICHKLLNIFLLKGITYFILKEHLFTLKQCTYKRMNEHFKSIMP